MMSAEFDVDEMADSIDESQAFKQFLEDPSELSLDRLEDQMAFVSDTLDVAFECDKHGILLFLFDAWGTAIVDHMGERFSNLDEWNRFDPIVNEISNLSYEQLNKTFADVWGFRSTERGISVSQSENYLHSVLLDNDDILEVKDTSTAQLGIDVYRKCMDLCDSSIHNLLSIKRASLGDDPRQVDLESIGFSASLNELDEYPFSNIVDGIDRDLRNGISHGDMVIDGIEEQVTIAGDKKYSYEEFEKVINKGIAIGEFVGFVDVFLIFEKFQQSKDNQGALYERMSPNDTE